MPLTFDIPAALREMLQPGQTIRAFWNAGNVNNEIRHIRAIVDYDWIAYRVWSARLGWQYYILWIGTLKVEFEAGVLSLADRAPVEALADLTD